MINYRSGRSGEVHKAWTKWKEDMPMESHNVVGFVAGFNAAKEQENDSLKLSVDEVKELREFLMNPYAVNTVPLFTRVSRFLQENDSLE